MGMPNQYSVHCSTCSMFNIKPFCEDCVVEREKKAYLQGNLDVTYKLALEVSKLPSSQAQVFFEMLKKVRQEEQ